MVKLNHYRVHTIYVQILSYIYIYINYAIKVMFTYQVTIQFSLFVVLFFPPGLNSVLVKIIHLNKFIQKEITKEEMYTRMVATSK